MCSGVVLLRASSFSPFSGCFLFLFHIIHIYGKASGAGLKPAFNFPKSNRLRRLLYPPCGASRFGLPEWFRVTRNTTCYLPEANKICLLLADHKSCMNRLRHFQCTDAFLVKSRWSVRHYHDSV